MNTRIFISYSRRDAIWLERLRVHLQPLVREGLVDLWDDSRIEPGMNWRDEVDRALSLASVAVLLVSADFLASTFISENELPALLEGAVRHGTRVLSTIVSPCLFDHHETLSKYQTVNPSSRPLTAMSAHDAEQTLVKLAETILAQARGPKLSSVPYVSHVESRSLTSESREPLRTSPSSLSESGKNESQVRFTPDALPSAIIQLLNVRRLEHTAASRHPDYLAKLARLEGAWINEIDDTHIYAKVIEGDLYMPYCFGGDQELKGVYYDWSYLWGTWFSQFRWIDGTWKGFSLHRMVSDDSIQGTWWGTAGANLVAPTTGIGTSWRRRESSVTPRWATDYFAAHSRTRP